MSTLSEHPEVRTSSSDRSVNLTVECCTLHDGSAILILLYSYLSHTVLVEIEMGICIRVCTV